MDEFEIDTRPVLRAAELVRETGHFDGTTRQAAGGRSQYDRERPKHVLRSAWLLDLAGLTLGFETIDYSVILPTSIWDVDDQPFVKSRVCFTSERLYELHGRGWRFRFLFPTTTRMGPALFLGGWGRVESPALIGDRDAFLTDMTIVRFCASLVPIGASARLLEHVVYREEPHRALVRNAAGE